MGGYPVCFGELLTQLGGLTLDRALFLRKVMHLAGSSLWAVCKAIQMAIRWNYWLSH